MELEKMWPGLVIVSLVPIMALITILDARRPFSITLARTLNVRAELALVGMLILTALALVAVFGLHASELVFELRGPLINKICGVGDDLAAVCPDESAEMIHAEIDVLLFVLDVLVFVISQPVVFILALIYRRPVLPSMVLGLFGTVGAIVWLVANRKSGVAKS